VIRHVVRVYRDAFSGLPPSVWVLSAVALVNRAGTMVLPFLSLYLTRELGFTPVRAGYVLGAFGFGSIVGSWLGGWLSDRVGPVRVQIGSLVGAGIGFVAIAGVRDPWVLGALVFATSAVGDAFRPASMTALVEHAPAEVHTRALALLRLAVNLGMAIGPAVGGWMASRNYTWVFLGDAATCWLAAMVLVWWRGRLAPVRTDARVGGPASGRSPWTDGPFLALLALVLLFGTMFLQVFATLPLYLKERYGLPENLIGAMFSLNALLIVALEMPLVRVLEGRRRLVVAAAGSLLVGTGFALMPLGAGVGFAALTVAVWTFGEMLVLPFTNSAVAQRADPRSRGSYMGAYTMAFAVSFILAPVVGTRVYQGLGPETLWYGVGVAGVVLAAGFFRLRRR
jgi:predicted MFS family arabinose efflux permease